MAKVDANGFLYITKLQARKIIAETINRFCPPTSHEMKQKILNDKMLDLQQRNNQILLWTGAKLNYVMNSFVVYGYNHDRSDAIEIAAWINKQR